MHEHIGSPCAHVQGFAGGAGRACFLVRFGVFFAERAVIVAGEGEAGADGGSTLGGAVGDGGRGWHSHNARRSPARATSLLLRADLGGETIVAP